jgi:hypothetical protein
VYPGRKKIVSLGACTPDIVPDGRGGYAPYASNQRCKDAILTPLRHLTDKPLVMGKESTAAAQQQQM